MRQFHAEVRRIHHRPCDWRSVGVNQNPVNAKGSVNQVSDGFNHASLSKLVGDSLQADGMLIAAS
ncbi:hypothetical protein AF72_06955 [Xylella taiwanensis]|uniref:Uncharacterized protein n=1 Tax=Xylella taiwanensis TaxID=1444770 RepID=Z9JKF7_9GAMM|nr:hypothetical protein AB672_07235 [Xylella taiwanensis]EWS78237.1 hypothetical protein AF72_06955 [Xylella taiwanensis]